MVALSTPPACATGLGGLPGTSSREAARIVAGELPDLLHVPQLPGRGPGADDIGRTIALLSSVSSDLAAETTVDGWRITSGAPRVMRRATSWLTEDLDRLEEAAAGYRGTVKAQVLGPWSLAAAIELPTGERALRDLGACAELSQALAEATVNVVSDLRRRFPGCPIMVQVDEPSLPVVLAGAVGTASGLSRYAPVDAQVAQRNLGVVLAAVSRSQAVAGVACARADVPIDLLIAAGAEFLALDFTVGVPDEPVGRAWERGIGLLAGSVSPALVESARDGRGIDDVRASAPVREYAARLGLLDPKWLRHVVVTPTGSLASMPPQSVVPAYRACRAAGRVLREDTDVAEGDLPIEQER